MLMDWLQDEHRIPLEELAKRHGSNLETVITSQVYFYRLLHTFKNAAEWVKQLFIEMRYVRIGNMECKKINSELCSDLLIVNLEHIKSTQQISLSHSLNYKFEHTYHAYYFLKNIHILI